MSPSSRAQHVGPGGRVGPLRNDRLTMRTGHRPNAVGMPHQLRGEGLRFVVRQVQSPAGASRRPPRAWAGLPSWPKFRPTSRSRHDRPVPPVCNPCRSASIWRQRPRPSGCGRCCRCKPARSSNWTAALASVRKRPPAGGTCKSCLTDATTVDAWPNRLRPSLMTRSTWSPNRIDDFFGGHGVGLAAAVGAGQGDRTGHHPQNVDHGLMGRHAQSHGAVGSDRLAGPTEQLPDQTVGMSVVATTIVTGPGQQRRASRRPSELRSGT